MQVLVAGMHRSGTSMVTRLLNLAGCYVGADQDLMQGMPDNPRGYWERLDICRLNAAALRAAGVEWNTTVGNEVETLGPAERGEIVHGFRELIHSLDEHRPWVVKDPRLNILLPLWRPLLSDCIVVYCHRHPLEVAASLQGRDGIPISIGVALWEVYNLAGLANTRDMTRIMVSHEAMLEDPVSAAQELFADLAAAGCKGIDPPDSTEISKFIERKLHRSTATVELVEEYLGATQTDLLAALDSGKDLERWSLDDLTQASRDLIIFYRETERFKEQAVAAQEQIDQLKRSVKIGEDWLREHVAPIEEMLRDGAADRNDVRAELQQVHEDKAAVGRLLESINTTKDELAAQLQQVHAEKADLGARFDAAQSEAVVLKGNIATLEATRERLESELFESRSEQASLAGRFEQAHHDLERVGGLLENAIAEKDAIARQLGQTHSEKAELGARLDQAHAEMTSLGQRIESMREERNALTEASRMAGEERSNLAGRLEQAHADLASIGKKLEQDAEERRSLEEQLRELNAVASELESLKRSHETARAEVADAKRSRDELRAIYQEVERRLQETTAEANVLKSWKRAFERRRSVRLYRRLQRIMGLDHEGPPVDLNQGDDRELGDDPS